MVRRHFGDDKAGAWNAARFMLAAHHIFFGGIDGSVECLPRPRPHERRAPDRRSSAPRTTGGTPRTDLAARADTRGVRYAPTCLPPYYAPYSHAEPLAIAHPLPCARTHTAPPRPDRSEPEWDVIRDNHMLTAEEIARIRAFGGNMFFLPMNWALDEVSQLLFKGQNIHDGDTNRNFVYQV